MDLTVMPRGAWGALALSTALVVKGCEPSDDGPDAALDGAIHCVNE